MRVGKLSPEKLNELVLDKIENRRSDILVQPKVGEDCAVVDFGDIVCVISTDPITGATKGIGRLAVHISCNDLAATGAEPVGIQLVLLLPDGISEDGIQKIMEEVDQGAEELGIDILGGHTEITSLVEKPVIVATAIGKARKDRFVTSSGATHGDEIVITKGAGIEGTAILAHDYEEYLIEQGVSQETIDSAKEFMEEISVLKEGLIGAKLGATAMHDVTEGGIYGSLFEMAQAGELGFELYVDQVYIRPETREICQVLDIDPLGLISSGTMMIATSDSDNLLKAFEDKGIEASKIGKIVEGENKVIVDGKEEEFELPARDELWRFIDEL